MPHITPQPRKLKSTLSWVFMSWVPLGSVSTSIAQLPLLGEMRTSPGLFWTFLLYLRMLRSLLPRVVNGRGRAGSARVTRTGPPAFVAPSALWHLVRHSLLPQTVSSLGPGTIYNFSVQPRAWHRVWLIRSLLLKTDGRVKAQSVCQQVCQGRQAGGRFHRGSNIQGVFERRFGVSQSGKCKEGHWEQHG